MSLYRMSEVTPNLLLGIGLYTLFVTFLFWRNNVTRVGTYHKPQPLLLILFFLHLLFAFEGGDYFHYMEWFHDDNYDSIEPVYKIIDSLSGSSYLLYRALIWGSAFFLFIATAKRFGLDVYKSAYLLYVMYISIFDYARATLGMAVYFYGFSFVCKPNFKRAYLSRIWGMILILLSIFFHSSMALLTALTIVVVVPLNKKSIIAGICLLLLALPLLNKLIEFMVVSSMNGDSRLNEVIVGYSSQVTEADSFSTFEWIRRWWQYTSIFFLPFLLITKSILNTRNKMSVPDSIKKMYKITFCILLMSFTILLVNLDTFILFYRFLFMSMIPICLMLYFCRSRLFISPYTYKFLIILNLLCVFFGYAKRLLGGNM